MGVPTVLALSTRVTIVGWPSFWCVCGGLTCNFVGFFFCLRCSYTRFTSSRTFFSISFACRSTSSLLAALFNSVSSDIHFNIASRRSCLSFIVWIILVRILSSLSANYICPLVFAIRRNTARSPCVMQSNLLHALSLFTIVLKCSFSLKTH